MTKSDLQTADGMKWPTEAPGPKPRCIQCGKPFEVESPGQDACSRACVRAYVRARS